MSRRDVAWLFVCIILGGLLIVSIILGVTGFFSSVSYLKSDTDLTVGDNVLINVLPNQASVASFTFDGSYMPNENIPLVIQINAQDLESEVNVRVKAKVFGNDNEQEFDFITTEHFEKAEDGYYYFDDVLRGGNKITFSTYVTTPSEGDFISNEKYVLTVIVETIEAEFKENIWGTIVNLA